MSATAPPVDPTRALPDREALREHVRRTLTRLSRTGELPTLPAAATAALALARSPEAGVEELSRVIRGDVGLSARVVRVANSAAYARRVPARSLGEAVLTLGLRKTCDLLVAAGARQLFGAVPQYAERLWNHALASALIAEEIARTTRATDPTLAFLPGLFHDVGRIGFLLADDRAFAVVHQEVYAVSRVRPEVERAWYGFDHAEAGAILTEEWGLAHDQVEAIRWHHQPLQAEPRARKLAAVLCAADAAAYALGLASGDPPPSDDDARACLGVDADALAQAAARARAAFDGQREIFV